jgi:uncharacterized membrane protein YdjX (TVP38/TMEM64 family)
MASDYIPIGNSIRPLAGGAMIAWIKRRTPVIFLSFTIIGLFCLSTLMTPTQIEAITTTAGRFGPLLVGLFIVLTQVFAPLSGTPVMIVGIKLYGYPQAMGLLYGSCLLSATLNFWIARLYGRTLVKKLVGEKALLRIDELSQINERTLLISARILGYSFFDLISYAVGLTTISFKKYFLYTALLTLIPFSVQYFLFSRLNFNNLRDTLIYFVSITAAGAIFARILYKTYFGDKPQFRESKSL